MRFTTTRGGQAVSFTTALFEGLAPDGGLYVPETIDPWPDHELARLPRRTLTEIALRALGPFTRGEIDPAVLEAVVVEALNFPIPLVAVAPQVYALELFHGPTLAFKDIGARVVARMMAALHEAREPLTVLAATSGDTGSAVAHAFYRVPNTRVVILYPDGRVSPTQEAQLTMFNGERGNVRAYAVAGSFDDCHRLTREAFGDADLRRRMRLTSANSVNIGRLLPQMVYYFHAVAQMGGRIIAGRAGSAPASAGAGAALAPPGAPTGVGAELAPPAATVFSTPSGNFGNLTAGLMAKRSGLPIARFVAATNVNDVVPAYLSTGRFTPRRSVQTLANAMDVGNPSNFERMSWLYGGDVEAIRCDIAGACATDDDVRATIREVYETRGYLLDPHSAIAYRGLCSYAAEAASGFRLRATRRRTSGALAEAVGGRTTATDPPAGIFLATAHPAKFGEIVEPIIGCAIEKPAPLAQALARPRHIIRIPAAFDAVREFLVSD